MKKELILVKAVQPINDYHLSLEFSTGERRIFDMRGYLECGVFQQLKDKALFAKAHIAFGTVVWPNDLDIAPETLYLESAMQ